MSMKLCLVENKIIRSGLMKCSPVRCIFSCFLLSLFLWHDGRVIMANSTSILSGFATSFYLILIHSVGLWNAWARAYGKSRKVQAHQLIWLSRHHLSWRKACVTWNLCCVKEADLGPESSSYTCFASQKSCFAFHRLGFELHLSTQLALLTKLGNPSYLRPTHWILYQQRGQVKIWRMYVIPWCPNSRRKGFLIGFSTC